MNNPGGTTEAVLPELRRGGFGSSDGTREMRGSSAKQFGQFLVHVLDYVCRLVQECV